jgi:hypothetical protein
MQKKFRRFIDSSSGNVCICRPARWRGIASFYKSHVTPGVNFRKLVRDTGEFESIFSDNRGYEEETKAFKEKRKIFKSSKALLAFCENPVKVNRRRITRALKAYIKAGIKLCNELRINKNNKQNYIKGIAEDWVKSFDLEGWKDYLWFHVDRMSWNHASVTLYLMKTNSK